jgi:hypothetical protein
VEVILEVLIVQRSAVRSIAWLDLGAGNTSIVFIEAIAPDRLPAASRTGLEIAADLVERATANPAIIACRMTQIVFAIAIPHAIILRRVYDELSGFDRWTVNAAPPRFFCVP